MMALLAAHGSPPLTQALSPSAVAAATARKTAATISRRNSPSPLVLWASRHRRGSSRVHTAAAAAAAARDSSASDDAEDAAAASTVAAAQGEEDGDSWGPWKPPLPPFDHDHHLLSWDVALALLDAKEAGLQRVDATLDFSITTVSLALLDGGFALAADADADADADAASESTDTSEGGALLATWEEVAEVAADEKGAYVLHPGAPVDRFQVFSEGTSRAVSLMPASPGMAPTALIAGFSMHRFGVGVDPMEDTARKLGAVHPIRPGARVLDVCTGLAYTAIGAYRRGGRVTTIELDPAMTQMCQMNPHSRDLFSGEIRQLYGNAADVVPTFPDASFDRIIHDPPTFALAGELFSGEFYGHLRRILAPKGRLYHYIGDPASKSAGNVAKGVVQRLKQAGFGGVAIDYDAHGVVAAHGPVKINSKKGPQKSFGKPASKGTSTDRRRGARGNQGDKNGGGRGGRGGDAGDARTKRGRGGEGGGGGGRRGRGGGRSARGGRGHDVEDDDLDEFS